jgi:hypothetical protein
LGLCVTLGTRTSPPAPWVGDCCRALRLHRCGRDARAPRVTAPRVAAMSSNEYHFTSDWQVEGTVDEVSAIITDAVSRPRWWPSVCLDVLVLQPGLKNGTQKLSGGSPGAGCLTPWTGHRGLLSRDTRMDLPWRLKVNLTVGEFGTSFKTAHAFSFAMIGRSEPTSHCSLLSPLCSNLSSKPTIAGPWNAEKRAFGLSWHDGVAAAQTSWPAYPRLQYRHGFLHFSCG